MKKLIIVSILSIIILYILCLLLKFNTSIIMLGCVMLSGALFFMCDGSPMNFNKPLNHTFIDLYSKEIEYINESQRKTAQDHSPFSAMLIAISLTAILCIIHFNLFIK